MGIDNDVKNKKMDIASRLECVANSFNDFVNMEFSDFSSYFTEKIEQNVLELLKVDKPKVMVYGIYNSGKSTLINSLCGEEVAEMADRPMTDRVSEYDRGDYYLVDSPGVDAPIQHEKVTEEHINKCHIILYVISSKGVFEDRSNYERLANLIKKGIPFIIVLNDRGYSIDIDWNEEKKKRAKFDHDQELKIIQYKIIQNLIKVSNDKDIADKYEVIILNAKKAWNAVLKNKPQLYENSGVKFLNTRILQLLTNKIDAVFKQPIANLKDCLNEIEKTITQTISGNKSEDFGIQLNILASKKDNIISDMRILMAQMVYKHLEELTNAYVNGDSDVLETISNTIQFDINDIYTAKINELFVCASHNFSDINFSNDVVSDLSFESCDAIGSKLSSGYMENSEEYTEENLKVEEVDISNEKSSVFDLFKSRKRKEKEKLERLERAAEIKNQREQYKVQESIRKKQESRQLANSDLNILCQKLNEAMDNAIREKYDDLISQIQRINSINKKIKEDSERQMAKVKELRNKIAIIENDIN